MEPSCNLLQCCFDVYPNVRCLPGSLIKMSLVPVTELQSQTGQWLYLHVLPPICKSLNFTVGVIVPLSCLSVSVPCLITCGWDDVFNANWLAKGTLIVAVGMRLVHVFLMSNELDLYVKQNHVFEHIHLGMIYTIVSTIFLYTYKMIHRDSK